MQASNKSATTMCEVMSLAIWDSMHLQNKMSAAHWDTVSMGLEEIARARVARDQLRQ